jgi:probable HAF family extracellular repeat protein
MKINVTHLCARGRPIPITKNATQGNSGATLIRTVLVASLLLSALGMTVLAFTPISDRRTTAAQTTPATASWSIVDSPNANDPQSNYLNGVACLSASDCWAIGYYYPDGIDLHRKSLIEHWDGTSWIMVAAPKVSGALYDGLLGVACSSTSDCWAVGEFNNSILTQTLIEHWDGNAWTIVSSPNSVTAPQVNSLSGVACASASDCWAVGYSQIATTNATLEQTLIEHWDGSSWVVITSPNTSPVFSNYLTGITCISSSDCWAVGHDVDANAYQTVIEHWDGASWTIVTSPNSDTTHNNALEGISCVSATECWAVGWHNAAGTGARTLVARWDGTSWAIVNSADPGATFANVLSGVTCVSASACWAVGYYIPDSAAPLSFSSSFYQTLVERWDGTSWTAVTSPNSSANKSNVLSAVACTSGSNCSTVGYHSSVPGLQTLEDQLTLAERWDGNSWGIVASPNPASMNNVLNAVTCISASDCWAVGDYYNAGGSLSFYKTLTEHWDGVSWSIATSANTPSTAYGNTYNFLQGITCTSRSNCWAVGYYIANSNSTNQTLIEHWDGSSWSIAPSPNTSTIQGNYLSSVTCVSDSDCWAAGRYVSAYQTSAVGPPTEIYQTLIEHWDGLRWSIVASPNTDPAVINELNSIACNSTSDCWAVGEHFSDNHDLIYQTLIEHWDGLSWTAVSSPNTSPLQSNGLSSITCSSSSDCWTVGSAAASNLSVPLIEHWDGANWTIANSSNPISMSSYLTGISCLSASDCTAGGYQTTAEGAATNQTFVNQTLVERWDGSTWSIVNTPNTSLSDNNLLLGVTCISGQECWATGNQEPAVTAATNAAPAHMSQTLALHYSEMSVPSPTPTATPTASPTGSATPTPTPTGTPSSTPTPTPTTSPSAAPQYSITDLGTLRDDGGGSSFSFGINNSGQVTGASQTNDGSWHAFVYSQGRMQDLGTFGGPDSAGYDINNSGDVTGWSQHTNSAGNDIDTAFLYSGAGMQNLGTLGGPQSYGFAINDVGQVCGRSYTALGLSNGSAHAFLYSNGSMQDLGTLIPTTPNDDSAAYGINNLGQVTGNATAAAGSHAFLYSGGKMQDLGTLFGGTTSTGYGINDAEQVVGESEVRSVSGTDYTVTTHAFLYSHGSMQDLGTLPGDTASYAYSINNFGWVVGNSLRIDHTLRAFLYSGGQMYDLNSLVPASTALTQIQVHSCNRLFAAPLGGKSINDSGQIAASAMMPDGNFHALVLTPVPPPVQTVVSRKVHGTVGNFDVVLPLTGTPGIECRSGGANGNQQLIFTFANPLTSVAGASVTSGTGSVSSNNVDPKNPNNYIVNLTGVANAQIVTVTLANVADSAGNFSSGVSASMGVLIGDVDGNGRVDGNDVSAVQSHTRQTIDATNYRYDVDANGRIDGNDVSTTQGQTRTNLP